MRRRLALSMVVAAVVSAVIAVDALAGASDPVVERTNLGASLARHALLTAQELGPRWTATTSPSTSPSVISCSNRKPDQSTLVETGLAGASFDYGSISNVTETVRVFRNHAQANASWGRTDNRALVGCSEELMAQMGQHVTRAERLPLPGVEPHAGAFRIVGSISRAPALGRGPDLVVPVYHDLVLLSGGRVQALVVFSSLSVPPARLLEERTARIVATRLDSGHAR